MSLDRSGVYGSPTDDAGDGTSGTAITNAFWVTFLDRLDSRWSEYVPTPAPTGVQNNYSLVNNSREADAVNFTSGSDVTFRGFVAPASPTKPGKPIEIYATGAGNVILNHEDTTATAANRILTDVGGNSLYLAGGRGHARLRYDNGNSRYRVLFHVQGLPIAYTANWTAASGTAPAIGNGSIASTFNVINGMCYIEVVLTAGSTTTFGNGGQLQFSLPFTGKTGALGQFTCSYIDTGTATYNGTAYFASTTVINLFTTANPAGAVTNTAPFTFGNTDLIRVSGWYPLA